MFDGYRLNAGIVVADKNGKVLVCLRKGTADSWQFPQGGIEKGETPLQAASRELKEETSITSVKHLLTLDTPALYDFPSQIARKLEYNGKKYRGQAMYWTLFRFTGNENEIKLDTEEAEFSAYRWVNISEAYDLIIDFKKSAYIVAVNAFSPYLSAE